LPGQVGADTFRYTLQNPVFGPATADVSIDVTAVNDPPVARDDRAVTTMGQAVVVPVTANDEDPNDPAVAGDPNHPGDPPTVAGVGAVTPPGAGTAACDSRACTFTPAAGWTGSARFTYTLADRGLPTASGVAAPLSATATVTVWVDPPRRTADGFTAANSSSLPTATGTWTATTASPSATGSCAAAAPRVVVSWPAVARATGYRLERRPANPPAGTDRWEDVAVVAAPATSFTDDVVGDGQTFRYRVTPLRDRWPGTPSPESSVGLAGVCGK
jgi:hypothetical protein